MKQMRADMQSQLDQVTKVESEKAILQQHYNNIYKQNGFMARQISELKCKEESKLPAPVE